VTLTELIDKVLAFTDNVAPTDLYYAARRVRIVSLLNQVSSDVWATRSWPFAMRFDSLPVPAGEGFTAVPEDFGELSEIGLVWDMATGRELSEALNAQQLVRGDLSGVTRAPYLYSIHGYDETSGRKTIYINRNDSDVELGLSYKALPPVFDEELTDPQLNVFPPPCHESVLLPGVIARTQKSKGDAREWQSTYINGLALMVRTERPAKTVVQRMPRGVVIR
jgi:hypothetical protein